MFFFMWKTPDQMQCPVCRADKLEEPNCRRCKADLTLMFAIEQQRGALLEKAAASAASGNATYALILARKAYALRVDAESARLEAVACLLNRDFAGAWAAYQGCTN